RTFRIIQLTGFSFSIGSIDLAAPAPVILATAPPTFIAFRELTSARGNALLQLSKPIQDEVDSLTRRGVLQVFVRVRGGDDEMLAIGSDIVLTGYIPTSSNQQRSRDRQDLPADLKARLRGHSDGRKTRGPRA